MKLEVKKNHENYCGSIIKLPYLQSIEGFDNLKMITVYGNNCLVPKTYQQGELYIYFPFASVLSKDFLSNNNLYRDNTKNVDNTKKGYFADSGKVKAEKMKGVVSSCIVLPISCLEYLNTPLNFKEGDEFTHINGVEICKKFKIQNSSKEKQERTATGKLENKFDKIVPNQFRFHESTAHFMKCISYFNLDDVIVISNKIHGTSSVYSNVLINKQLTWKEKLAKWFGIHIVTTEYGNLYSSRSVLKNKYINPNASEGYYNEDIWGVVNEELKGKIEEGITLYGEIVGMTPNGKWIQKNYDYSALVQEEKKHGFFCYRITYTKPNGQVIEFSHNQILNYCKKYNIDTPPIYFFGTIRELLQNKSNGSKEAWQENFVDVLHNSFNLEKKCTYCTNDVPAEGIIIRKDGMNTFEAYKLKAKLFLLGEEKEQQKGISNLEDEN